MEKLRPKLPSVLIILLLALALVVGTFAAAHAQQTGLLDDWMPGTDTHQAPQQQGDTTAHHGVLIGEPGQIPEAPPPARVIQTPNGIMTLPPALQQLPSLSDNGGTAAPAQQAPQAKNKMPAAIKPKMPAALPTAAAEVPFTRAKPAPKLDIKALAEDNSHVRDITLQVHVSGHDKAAKADEKLMHWALSSVDRPIFIQKVADLEPALAGTVSVPKSRTSYQNISVTITLDDGSVLPPIKIYANRVELPGKSVPLEDTKRDTEFWLFGTADTYKQRLRATELLDIMTFRECMLLGHTIVETDPRQCVLPNGTTFLEVELSKPLTEKEIAIRDFEACLKGGYPLILTFPRKCVAPGGRVYVEPPRLDTGELMPPPLPTQPQAATKPAAKAVTIKLKPAR